MHYLAGITLVGLQQQSLLVAAAAPSGGVIEQAFAAAVQGVVLHIAGRLLAETLVVGRHIA